MSKFQSGKKCNLRTWGRFLCSPMLLDSSTSQEIWFGGEHSTLGFEHQKYLNLKLFDNIGKASKNKHTCALTTKNINLIQKPQISNGLGVRTKIRTSKSCANHEHCATMACHNLGVCCANHTNHSPLSTMSMITHETTSHANHKHCNVCYTNEQCTHVHE
jgi:hypothetical protein